MKIYLIHGFNIHDGGDSTIGRMKPYYEALGYEVEVLKYPWMFILGSYGLNWYHAKRFAKKLKGEKDFILVGHSNGNVIIDKMIRNYGVRPKGWVAINPALDSDHMFPRGTGFVHIYYNKGDVPTKWAKYLPLHPWGSMGRVGYTGGKRKVIQQWDCGRTSDCKLLNGHSDMFTVSHVECWTTYTATNFEKVLS